MVDLIQETASPILRRILDTLDDEPMCGFGSSVAPELT